MARTIMRDVFIREFHSGITNSNSKFAFFLGAGCSVSSGIPTAGGLVHKRWLPEWMYRETGSRDGDVAVWAAGQPGFADYTPEKAGAYYGAVIEELFNQSRRQREIDDIVGKNHPAFGYGVLARLLSHQSAGPLCNLILTTNFDDLVADALYLYGDARPLVIGHEALIGFARADSHKPLVVKLHGDHHLEPKNTTRETAALADDVERVLGRLLDRRGLVFFGYAGADQSIASALDKLPVGHVSEGVYWVNDVWPDGPLGAWLDREGAVWVQHRDFDEAMLAMMQQFGLQLPNIARFQALVDGYAETVERLTARLSHSGADAAGLQTAAQEAARQVSPAWATLLERRSGAAAELEQARGAGDAWRLFWALIELGDIDRDLGSRAEAMESYSQAQDVAQQHSAAAVDDNDWRRKLSVSHERIGNIKLDQGDRAGALAAYQASLKIREPLAAGDPGNAQWQRDLSVSHEKIGNIKLAEGDREGALAAYQASLAIAESLAARDPGNAQWQRDLSISHNKIGDIKLAGGDRDAARAAYQASLKIREPLAARDPGNAGWQRDLGASYWKIAAAQDDGPAGRAAALDYYRRALAVMERQIAAGRWAPVDAHYEEELRQRIAGLL